MVVVTVEVLCGIAVLRECGSVGDEWHFRSLKVAVSTFFQTLNSKVLVVYTKF